jgi:hypothetical protein
MNEFKAGDFVVTVYTGAYPINVCVEYGGQQALRLRHDQLRDLRYALKKAMKAARRALPASYHTEI